MREQYNTFVTGNREILSAHSKRMQDYFRRTYGGGGQRQLDSYVTEIANQVSKYSINDPDFCSASAVLFETVTRQTLVDTAGEIAKAIPVSGTPELCAAAPATKSAAAAPKREANATPVSTAPAAKK